MRRSRVAPFLASLGLIFLSGSLVAQDRMTPQSRRVALVIGVSEYHHLPPISRPAGDAQAVHEALEGLGFEANLVVDPDHRALDEAVTQFTQSLQPDDVAVVHFAGHAARLNEDFLLLPTNAPARSARGEDLQRTSGIRLAEMADDIRAAGARAQVFVVDACRGDAYARSETTDLAPSSCGEIGRQMPEGSFVLFSASAGQRALDRLAQDDPEPNSVFTRVFLKQVTQVRSVVRLARLVRDEVVQITTTVNYQQRPAYLDELVGPPVLLVPRESRQAPATADVLPPTTPRETAAPRERRRPAEQTAFQCGGASPGAPAFDCRSARQEAEVAICRDPGLGSCDQVLNELFEQAQSRLGRRAAGLRQAQEQWLAERDACAERAEGAAVTDCIGQAYDARIAELDAIVTGSVAPRAEGPSFDCAFARSPVEQAICRDPALAAKDREMADLFAQARSQDPRGIERAQREWRALRDSCTRLANTAPDLLACIGEAYDLRITQLGAADRR